MSDICRHHYRLVSRHRSACRAGPPVGNTHVHYSNLKAGLALVVYLNNEKVVALPSLPTLSLVATCISSSLIFIGISISPYMADVIMGSAIT